VPHRLPTAPRIAIIKLSALGDVIHALPVARALRRHFPDATLTWIVERRATPVVSDHPDLDEVIAIDTRRWRQHIWRPGRTGPVLGDLSRLRARLRRGRFDVALDLQGLAKSAILTRLTRAPVRIGFARSHSRELSWLAVNRRVVPPPSAVHVVEQYLSLLAPLGIGPVTPEFRLPGRPAAEQRMGDFLGEHGLEAAPRLVALNPGAGRADKRWPLAHFRALAERLGGDADARVLLLWGPGEVGLAREIADGLSPRPILAPPTEVDELAALLRRAALVIAGDTGPLHLAAAVGTPALGLYGPTRAERNGPYGPHGSALQSADRTMAGLAPSEVFAAARARLDSRPARR
jgi:heptosyltransferase-1